MLREEELEESRMRENLTYGLMRRWWKRVSSNPPFYSTSSTFLLNKKTGVQGKVFPCRSQRGAQAALQPSKGN
jgi:hypothetical protein